jgi:tetrapyrrole methylase family protein / MazG family protein
MPQAPSKKLPPIRQLLDLMAALRAPDGCPWDREQDHKSLRWHAVEEVYELLDAIENDDDHEMAEELGDLLLQVVFHAQLARERGAFDFDALTQRLVDKLVRRHPHVFGDVKVRDVDQVWANWEQIKRAEKAGSKHERKSALDGIPARLPALMRAQKLVKKARKAKLAEVVPPAKAKPSKAKVAAELFRLAELCQTHDWSAEELLRQETGKRERAWRKAEQRAAVSLVGLA